MLVLDDNFEDAKQRKLVNEFLRIKTLRNMF